MRPLAEAQARGRRRLARIRLTKGGSPGASALVRAAAMAVAQRARAASHSCAASSGAPITSSALRSDDQSSS